MRKIIFLAFLCLFAVSGFAQSSFYVSAQAAPGFAYANPNPTFHYANKKLTSNYGIGFGYEFPNQLIKVETGIYRTKIFTIFSLNGRMSNYGKDQIYMTRNSWQVPLRFKLNFWQPTDKLTFRAITGIVLSLTPDDFKLQGDLINISNNSRGTTFQTPSSARQHTEFLYYGNINGRNGIGAVYSNWLIESGAEISYAVTSKISGFLGIVYQGGIQSKYNGRIYSIYTDPTSGQISSPSALYAGSKANALNLNIGLTYAF